MSYEGHDVYLCKNGHKVVFDAHEDVNWHMFVCSCGEGAAWRTAVDETNGIDEETGHCPGYVELEIASNAEYAVCSLGFSHVTREATFKIPQRGVGHHVDVDNSSNQPKEPK